jgi:hypothetical protein
VLVLVNARLIDVRFHPSRGFTRDDTWGYRSLEPTRTVISSIALVLLKTGITHHPAPNRNQSLDRDDQSKDEESVDEKGVNEDADEDAYVTVDQGQMGTAQKLLLFWRKPAVSTPVRCSSLSVVPLLINLPCRLARIEEMLVGRDRGSNTFERGGKGNGTRKSMG